MHIQIESAQSDDRASITTLLQQAQLLTDDLPADLHDFVIAKEASTPIGVAGLERYDRVGLLRSVAVSAHYQGQQIATQLISRLLDRAQASAVTEVYLITTTADQYFLRHGFRPVHRQDVPAAIQQTQQFSSLCPLSAIVMKRSVIPANS